MISLSALLYLDRKWIGMLGCLMVLTHNLADTLHFEDGSAANFVWSILHVQTALPIFGGRWLITAYPLIPWVGVLLLGYALGAAFVVEIKRRQLVFWWLGGCVIATFILLRASNLYGDPTTWERYDTWELEVLSFLNCTKYPPSLLFLLMTLGVLFLILGFTSEKASIWKRPLLILGRAPLFYYLLHIAALHALAIVMSFVTYGRADWWFRNPPFPGMPEDYGWSLPVVYLAAMLVVVLLIPLCAWYRRLSRILGKAVPRRRTSANDVRLSNNEK